MAQPFRPRRRCERAEPTSGGRSTAAREPLSDNQKIFRAIASGFGPHSVIALIPDSSGLAVVVGVLGDYVGTLRVPADTRTFPNSGEYRQGQFFLLKKPVPICDSTLSLRLQMLRWAGSQQSPGG